MELGLFVVDSLSELIMAYHPAEYSGKYAEEASF